MVRGFLYVKFIFVENAKHTKTLKHTVNTGFLGCLKIFLKFFKKVLDFFERRVYNIACACEKQETHL